MSIISLAECGSSVPMYAGPAAAVAFRTGLPKSKRKYLRPVLRSFVILSHSVPTLVLPCDNNKWSPLNGGAFGLKKVPGISLLAHVVHFHLENDLDIKF